VWRPQACTSRACTSRPCTLHLMGVHLASVYLTGLHLAGVHTSRACFLRACTSRACTSRACPSRAWIPSHAFLYLRAFMLSYLHIPTGGPHLTDFAAASVLTRFYTCSNRYGTIRDP